MGQKILGIYRRGLRHNLWAALPRGCVSPPPSLCHFGFNSEPSRDGEREDVVSRGIGGASKRSLEGGGEEGRPVIHK